jgi:selenide, water dikinase
MSSVKLTQYSHGAGCGCKIAPQILEKILHSNFEQPNNNKLLVGNNTKDDAAVYDLENGQALISTTDFFMPIVDDPYNFGRIASANAISDVYAMGGTPILAIAILGFPINKLEPEIAQKIIEGSRSICKEAGITLAGGHSIDCPEPVFGLAVNGLVAKENIKQNNKAQAGDVLLLTKPLGVGILTTAQKKDLLKNQHIGLAENQMMQLNKIGAQLGKLSYVHAITDVTGFGLLGHLIEMAEGSNLNANLFFNQVPLICNDINEYINNNCVPGGTQRNWDSYGHKVSQLNNIQRSILADPQTSGGLLIAVKENNLPEIVALFNDTNLNNFTTVIGNFTAKNNSQTIVNVQ